LEEVEAMLSSAKALAADNEIQKPAKSNDLQVFLFFWASGISVVAYVCLRFMKIFLYLLTFLYNCSSCKN
jgi:hypothetical protein